MTSKEIKIDTKTNGSM